MAIDTLAFAKYLESAGIDRKLAEAHAEAMNQHVFPQLATKTDLDHAVIELKSELTRGMSELSTRISETNKAMSELTVRLMLGVVATAGLAITVAKLL